MRHESNRGDQPSVLSKKQKVSVMSVDDLIANLDKEVYQVVDTRTLAKYEASHIPNSVHMQWEDWTELSPRKILNTWFGDPAKLGRVLDDTVVVQDKLCKAGLNSDDDARIIVVGEPFGWGEEGRVAWNLLYWGAADVSLLDGGFPAWLAAGGAIQTDIAAESPLSRFSRHCFGAKESPTEGTFHVCLQSGRRATLEQVEEAVDNADTDIIDARSAAEFEGTMVLPCQKRKGRICGAHSLSAMQLYHEDGTFLSSNELESILLKGRKPTGDIIAYCTAGIRSALLAVLVEARLGVTIKNYDASIWEWSAIDSKPMENGAIY